MEILTAIQSKEAPQKRGEKHSHVSNLTLEYHLPFCAEKQLSIKKQAKKAFLSALLHNFLSLLFDVFLQAA